MSVSRPDLRGVFRFCFFAEYVWSKEVQISRIILTDESSFEKNENEKPPLGHVFVRAHRRCAQNFTVWFAKTAWTLARTQISVVQVEPACISISLSLGGVFSTSWDVTSSSLPTGRTKTPPGVSIQVGAWTFEKTRHGRRLQNNFAVRVDLAFRLHAHSFPLGECEMYKEERDVLEMTNVDDVI